MYIVSALQGFLAEHFTPIRKPVCFENINLLDFPPFIFAAQPPLQRTDNVHYLCLIP